jgi:ADP-heptose:LPS heptosyltransferase
MGLRLFNPFDRLLKRARKEQGTRILLCWNRGLGDIPLGLYALVHRIKTIIPQAHITFITRSDLSAGFEMLEGVTTYVAKEWKRGVAFDLDATLLSLSLNRSDFDLLIEHPDPTKWVSWQLGTLTPKLSWKPSWDLLSKSFSLTPDQTYIGVHVQTETHYGYEKNWPQEYWRLFFQRVIEEKKCRILLFGVGTSPVFEGEGIIDLRGKTTLLEMFCIIKNHCHFLVVPDSGVLSITYYIDASFPIRIVSLWADPWQGVLKQNVASPNPLLCHTPLIAKQRDLRSVLVDTVMEAL